MGDPRPADEATHGDDRIGEVEERVDHLLAAFVALEPVERVVPAERLEPDASSLNSVPTVTLSLCRRLNYAMAVMSPSSK